MKQTFILLFLCIGLHVFAQSALQVDYRKIQQTMKTDLPQYDSLLQRYEKNDTTLTLSDCALIYYGFSFSPSYQGSMDSNQTPFNEFIKKQQYQEAYELGKSWLKKNPVSLYALAGMINLCTILGLTAEEMDGYIFKYQRILSTILASGDGQTTQTAYKVICINDEYQVLKTYFDANELIDQSLIDDCDLMEFTSGEKNETKKIYFDISRSLDYMESLFKK